MSETNTAALDSRNPDTANKPDKKKFKFSEFKHPGVPALYNPRPKANEKYMPYAAFGFLITMKDKNDFAERFDYDASITGFRRREAAMRKLINRIPAEYKRYVPITVMIQYHELAMCIVLGTNETEEDIYHTLNMDMIEDVSEILQTYGTPGWFLPCKL